MENEFHVGRMIERVLVEKGMTKKQLSQKLDFSKNWAAGLTQRDSISTAILLRLSDVLEYNFFEELGRQSDFILQAKGPTQIVARLSLTEEASLTEAIQYLETHFLPSRDENKHSHPLVLTHFSVLLGDMGGGGQGRGPDDHRNPKTD